VPAPSGAWFHEHTDSTQLSPTRSQRSCLNLKNINNQKLILTNYPTQPKLPKHETMILTSLAQGTTLQSSHRKIKNAQKGVPVPAPCGAKFHELTNSTQLTPSLCQPTFTTRINKNPYLKTNAYPENMKFTCLTLFSPASSITEKNYECPDEPSGTSSGGKLHLHTDGSQNSLPSQREPNLQVPTVRKKMPRRECRCRHPLEPGPTSTHSVINSEA
jgi:hypothetical protein